MDAPDPEPATQAASPADETRAPEDTVAPVRQPGFLAAGARVSRYVVLSQLGSGGMGVVYTAYDPELDRKVALKVVRAELVGRGESHARFVREARAMARISHRGVVPIHDVGTAGDTVFLAMELVEGKNFRQWLDETRPGWRRALATLLDAGRGLAAAHAAEIVHRDVKPANLLVGPDGRARVTDFGLARTGDEDVEETDSDASSSSSEPSSSAEARGLTRTGAILGTPAYMAPEQHIGRRSDARCDQFAFCVVLYEALYGERPFASTRSDLPANVALAMEVTAGRVRPVPKDSRVPAWLRRVVLRGLAVDPAARWPSMDALLDEIEETPRRRRRPLLFGGGALAVAAVGVAFVAGRSAPAEEDPCRGGPALLASSWAPADRSVELARLSGLGGYGSAAAQRIGGRVADFGARWTRGHLDACVAHRRDLQSDALFDRRVACLERGRNALGALRGVVTSSDAKGLAGAVVAAQGLPDPDACADAAALLAAVPPPPAEKAGEAAALAATLDRAQVLFDAGRFADAEREASAVVVKARPLGYAPLLARALMLDGRAAASITGGRERAVPILAESAQVAMTSGDDGLAVETWARSAWASRTQGARDLAPIPGLDLIVALASRPSSTARARALLFSSVGTIEIARGQRAAARGWYERALEAKKQVPGRRPLELVQVDRDIGKITDDPLQRDTILAGVQAQLEHAVGAEHPETLLTRFMRGMWHPEFAPAIALLRPTCETYQRLHGASLPAMVAECWHEVAYLAEELGHRDEAVEAMTRAANVEGASPAVLARSAAYRQLWQGDLAGASQLFITDLASMPRKQDEPWFTTLRRGEIELGLGRSQRAVGDGRAAAATLGDAVRDLTTALASSPAGVIGRRLVRARVELAMALSASGVRDSVELRATAQLAAQGLRAAGGRAEEIAALDRLAATP